MNRVEQTKTERRRRSGMGLDRTRKLYVPEAMKDKNFEYRWINDVPGRIESKTIEDDWDVVMEQRNGEEIKVSRVVDTTRSGQSVRAYLCRKPKKLYDQDKAEEQKIITSQEEAMKTGPLPNPAEGGVTESKTTYVPGGRNTIGRS